MSITLFQVRIYLFGEIFTILLHIFNWNTRADITKYYIGRIQDHVTIRRHLRSREVHYLCIRTIGPFVHLLLGRSKTDRSQFANA